MASFFDSPSATDLHFIALRDSPEPFIREGKAFVERLWTQVSPYVDEDISRKASTAYVPCFWEMYVAHALLEAGIDLVARRERTPTNQGPDLLADRPRVWIEAVAPTAGTGKDAVPELKSGGVFAVPDEQIKLRLRSAVDEKRAKIATYRKRGWISDIEPAVIAVSGARIDAAMFEMTIPRIIRCVLPFGDETFHVDSATLEMVNRSFKYHPTIRKRSGASVSTEVFLDPQYASISAVLYSRVTELNRTPATGQDFILCHNPLATAPLPRGWLPLGWEYWVADDHLIPYAHAPAGI